MSAYKRVQQWATFARCWHVYDCKWQDPYQSGVRIAHYLRGMHKPIFHPSNDCGDVVVAINSRHIALRGDDWRKMAYFHHRTFPGTATWTLAWQLHAANPTLVLRKAVYRSMRGTLQRRHTMERLLVFPDDELPDDVRENISATIRPVRELPDRLDHLPQDTLDNFPKVMDYPKDYIVR